LVIGSNEPGKIALTYFLFFNIALLQESLQQALF
jgi:hypothetical protein